MKQWLYFPCSPTCHWDSNLGTGRVEFQTSASELDHNALRAIRIPSNSIENLRTGLSDLLSILCSGFSIPTTYQEHYVNVLQQRKSRRTLF